MLENVKAENIHVEFSDPKSDWKEEVCFTDLLNAIIEFVKKILAFEFDL